MKELIIYTDGGCKPNPGTGGWAAVIIDGQQSSEIYGGVNRTTNNRMELMAAVMALQFVSEPAKITLFTDSVYLRSGISAWVKKWKRNNWRLGKRSEGKPVKNKDLWMLLDDLNAKHKVVWTWVRGHSGNKHNERCDLLARQGRIDAIRARILTPD